MHVNIVNFCHYGIFSIFLTIYIRIPQCIILLIILYNKLTSLVYLIRKFDEFSIEFERKITVDKIACGDHSVNLFCGIPVDVEVTRFRFILVELFGPLSMKVDSIQEKQYGIWGNMI